MKPATQFEKTVHFDKSMAAKSWRKETASSFKTDRIYIGVVLPFWKEWWHVTFEQLISPLSCNDGDAQGEEILLIWVCRFRRTLGAMVHFDLPSLLGPKFNYNRMVATDRTAKCFTSAGIYRKLTSESLLVIA